MGQSPCFPANAPKASKHLLKRLLSPNGLPCGRPQPRAGGRFNVSTPKPYVTWCGRLRSWQGWTFGCDFGRWLHTANIHTLKPPRKATVSRMPMSFTCMPSAHIHQLPFLCFFIFLHCFPSNLTASSVFFFSPPCPTGSSDPKTA